MWHRKNMAKIYFTLEAGFFNVLSGVRTVRTDTQLNMGQHGPAYRLAHVVHANLTNGRKRINKSASALNFLRYERSNRQ